MSEINFNPDLFLGKQEIDRMYKFLNEKFNTTFGFKSGDYGLLGAGSNFYSVPDNTGSGGHIRIPQDSYFIDKDMNLAILKAVDIYSLPSGWSWLKVSYATTIIESGTIRIGTNGACSGIGTEFTKTLRGIIDFPTKISFPNSIMNTGEYEVLSVNSDVSITLNSNLISEHTQYAVVGSFTPGSVIPDANKYPFRYGSCKVSVVPETVTATAPTKTDGYEFYICRFNVSGGYVDLDTFEDRRSEFHPLSGLGNVYNLVLSSNPASANIVNSYTNIGVGNTKYVNLQQTSTSSTHNVSLHVTLSRDVVKIFFTVRLIGALNKVIFALYESTNNNMPIYWFNVDASTDLTKSFVVELVDNINKVWTITDTTAVTII